MANNQASNPGIFPLLLFGYALAVLGVELIITHEAAGALVFAVLIAAIAETIGGLWEIAQGKTYIGSVIATFGIWLIGLFMLETAGRVLGIVSPETLAAYFLVLLVPIALLALPAFRKKMALPMRGAFVSLFLLILLAGINFLLSNPFVGLAAGAFAWLAALCIWTIAAEHISAAET